MARTHWKVRIISNTQTNTQGGSTRCCGGSGILALAATVVVTATLGGCGTSPSHQAQVRAQRASARASMLLMNAGRYHRKANFPVAIPVPLSSAQLIAAKNAAKLHPEYYIQKPSVGRDLRHAGATLATALSNPDLNFQFKGLLTMQRGLVNDAAAQVHANELSQALIELRNQVLAVDTTATQVGHFAEKIAFLQKQHDLYLHLYDSNVAHAMRMQRAAAGAVIAAQKRADTMMRTLTHYQKIARVLTIRGMALQAKGAANITPARLVDFKRGAGLLDRAAAANALVKVLQIHYQLADMALQSARQLRVQWANQVEALRQSQKAAAEMATSDQAQIAALKAGVTVLIDGAGDSSPTSVAARAVRINTLIKIISQQAALAQKYTAQASVDLMSALNQQRRSTAYAQHLIATGFKPEDPLVVANQNRAPECALEVYRAAVALKAGQIAAMQLYAAQLQKSAATAGARIFTIVNEASPLLPPPVGGAANFRKQAMLEFNVNAAGALKQAQNAYPVGSSPWQWIVPAMMYNVDLSVAGISDNAALRAAALKAAAASAQEAHKVNSSLNLPLPGQ
ncbi:MAG: hypothetical protein ACP5I8_11925 [Phycisphaerae bacterium]